MIERLVSFVEYVGGVTALGAKTVRTLMTTRLDFGAFIYQMRAVGNKTFMLVALVGVFSGMVMALQMAVGLERFGLKHYIGQIIGLSVVRELGPVLTCIMISARVGSGIAAELGSMVVTEQVLAIEAMGANPTAKLVLPRVLACVLAAPILTVMADCIGVVGGMLITQMEAGVTARYYFDQIFTTVQISDFTEGVAKTLFFGFFVGVIACYQSLLTTGGTEGVGRSTTKAVVYSSMAIFISDFFLTKLFLLF